MTVAELFAGFGLKVDEASFKRANDMLKGLRRTASSIVTGIGISLGIRGLMRITEEATHAGTHILGMSTALGMSTKTFQEWSYVAKRAGSDANQFSVGVSMFERNLKEFAAGRGSKRFKESMVAVGLSTADAKNALASPDGINNAIFKVADAYQKMGNTATRAAINTGLFGQRARGMAQDLSQGSAALKEQIGSLHAMGGVMSEEELNTLKKADNTLTDLKTQLHVIAMRAVVAFGPQLIEMLQNASRWIQANADTLKTILGGALETLGMLFKALGVIVSGFVGIFGSWSGKALALLLAFGKFRGLIGVFTGLGAAAKGVRLEMELMSALAPFQRAERVVKMHSELDRLKGEFPGLSPAAWGGGAAGGGAQRTLGSVVTKLGAIAIAAYAGYRIGLLIKENWSSIKNTIGEIADRIRSLGSTIRDAFGDAWDWVKARAQEVGDWIWDKISWPFRKLKGAVGSVISSVGPDSEGPSSGNWAADKARDFAAARMGGLSSVPAGGGRGNTSVTVHVGGVSISAKDVKDGTSQTGDELANHVRQAFHAVGGDAP